MSLPRLILIADLFSQARRAERAAAAVAAGIRWVHLRDHEADDAVFDAAARALVSHLRDLDSDVVISINTRLATARALGIGLHVGRRGPSVAAARQALGKGALIGFSAHDAKAGRQAKADGADYLFLSPVFPTASKPGQAGVGAEGLQDFCRAVAGTPVFALGGITPGRVAVCRAAGAYGVVVLSGILTAADPAEAARAYRAALTYGDPESPIRDPT